MAWRRTGTASAFCLSSDTVGCGRIPRHLVATGGSYFFLLVVIILIILRHTVTISGMEAEIKELAMQLTLLKDENEEIKKNLGAR